MIHIEGLAFALQNGGFRLEIPSFTVSSQEWR
jgi:hypothetical protein